MVCGAGASTCRLMAPIEISTTSSCGNSTVDGAPTRSTCPETARAGGWASTGGTIARSRTGSFARSRCEVSILTGSLTTCAASVKTTDSCGSGSVVRAAASSIERCAPMIRDAGSEATHSIARRTGSGARRTGSGVDCSLAGSCRGRAIATAGGGLEVTPAEVLTAGVVTSGGRSDVTTRSVAAAARGSDAGARGCGSMGGAVRSSWISTMSDATGGASLRFLASG